jgi:hypothetical protein
MSEDFAVRLTLRDADHLLAAVECVLNQDDGGNGGRAWNSMARNTISATSTRRLVPLVLPRLSGAPTCRSPFTI